MTTATYVRFEVAGVACALAREQVRRVLPLPALDRPPGRPSVIEGVLDLAGAAIPVLRLDRLLGLPESPLDPYRHLILLQQSRPRLALLVDRVTEVSRLPEERWAALDDGETFNGCVIAATTIEGLPINLLDAGRLLVERVRQSLVEFGAIQQRRLEDFGASS